MPDFSSSIKCGVRSARNVPAKDVLEEEHVSEGKGLYTIRMQSNASATSKSTDAQITSQVDGLSNAMSELTAVKGRAPSNTDFRDAMLSMGKTLIEQKKSGSQSMTFQQRKKLVVEMVQWTKNTTREESEHRSIKCGVRSARNVPAKDVLEEEHVSEGKGLYTIRMQSNASATSKSTDAQITSQVDGLSNAMSELTAVKGRAPSNTDFRDAMLSMGKTLIEQKKSGSQIVSSVVYEAQGTFLLKMYLKRKFLRKAKDFTPFACKGMLLLMKRLKRECPATEGFKTFFSLFTSYVKFIKTASTTSESTDTQLTTKVDALTNAISELTGAKSGSNSNFRETMLSMGKTLIEQKRSSSQLMTHQQKKVLVVAMVQWTKTLVTLVKTAVETAGKSIDVSNLGLDVDVNSVVGNGSDESPKSDSPSDSDSPTATSSGSVTYEDTTGGGSGSPSGSPTDSPSGTTTDSPSGTTTDSPNDTTTDSPSESPTDSPSGTTTDSPSGTTTDSLSGTTTDSPSGSPTDSPSGTTTDSPSDTTTDSPSGTTTDSPSGSPTDSPSGTTTDSPSGSPTDSPSGSPTDSPSDTTTDSPSGSPTDSPSDTTTDSPSGSPTDSPSDTTTDSPSGTTTDSPSGTFTDSTGGTTTDSPSGSPTDSPSGTTTDSMSDTTTESPSGTTMDSLSGSPTDSPSGSPTDSPSGITTDSPSGTTTDSPNSPSESPTDSPSGSKSASGETSVKESGSDSEASAPNTNSESSESSTSSSSTTSAKEVEIQTSKEARSFIHGLEKKYAGTVQLDTFFEKLKTSMSASTKISNTDEKRFVSKMNSAVSSVSEAATTVSSKLAKSPEAKNRAESSQEKLMKTYKELEDVNSKIVSENKGKTVSSTQQSELRKTLSKWEQVTTQFVENLASSSSSSSSSSQSQQSQQSQQSHQSQQSQQGSAMKTQTD
ncbi:hypothetical protein Bca52824_030114 [Brassica carinata]|uniref:DUF1216 domain-containing protein n=1 Tax=Brassica carinata TaxID=52824 RepID=A0A8X7S5L9_BRACI|nr:hypothetical protein Bca52824_030114 [Brassica carinata]